MNAERIPMSQSDSPPSSWGGERREKLVRYAVLLAVFGFLAFSVDFLDVRLDRVGQMFGKVGEMLALRYYPPDIGYVLDSRYLGYVLDTIQMSFLGTLLGLLLAAPLAWFAAFNVSPRQRQTYYFGRFAIMASRSVHEMIWAILFVAIVGYGTFAGVLALTLFCVGFAGKLFAEEIEAIDMGPVEAVRSTGANELQVFRYGVLPQVRVRWTGISIYTWDVAFRAATVVGFFGAGGMGWYLKRAVQQVQSDRVSAILLSIIAMVIVAEVISAWVRQRVERA